MYDQYTPIETVANDPVFEGHGRLLFSMDSGFQSGTTLESLSFTWYNYMDPFKTVEIANYFHDRAASGEKFFIEIYSDEEKAADPDKNETGIWFFRGEKGAPTAILSAGGAFRFVGAMQDSFPHGLEISKKGYNAFCVIYRPHPQKSMEDLARAIRVLYDQADDLQISLDGYSLWGGSAGARMAALMGSMGTEAYGEKACPRAGTVIMQYTGLSEVFGNEPPTYNCVGTADWIAKWQVMKRRIEGIRANGTPAEIEIFEDFPHGFGLAERTAARGWLDRAVDFWIRQIK